jgi:hypothetical protein
MRDYPTPGPEEAELLLHAKVTGDNQTRPRLQGQALQDAVNALVARLLPPGYAFDYDALDGALWPHAPSCLSLRFYGVRAVGGIPYPPDPPGDATRTDAALGLGVCLAVEIHDRRDDPDLERIWPGDPDAN